MAMTTYPSVGQRTAAMAATPPRRRKPQLAQPMPMPPLSSMSLPNAAGQTGPVPVRGIINSAFKRS